MSAADLPVGLVGCGHWGRNILRDLIRLECQVAVAAQCESSRKNAHLAGAAIVVEHIQDLPASAGFIVATPASTHAEVIEALMPRNVPIFCEKPFTTDLADARRLAAKAEGRLFVMDKWRYHPGIIELAKFALSGELGEVLALETTRLGGHSPQSDVDCTWTLLPHELTIALEILGHVPKPKRARVQNTKSGGISSFCAELGELIPHKIVISAVDASPARSVELICVNGRAILPDAYSDNVLVKPKGSRESNWQRRPIARVEPLLAELRAFVDHLQGGPAPRSSAAEGAAVVEAIVELRRLAGLGDSESTEYQAA